MRTHLYLCLTLVFVSLFARADGGFFNKSLTIAHSADQRAILIRDRAAGMETMVLSTMYDGTLAEYGWVIPVPNLPTREQVTTMPASYVFNELDAQTAPRVRITSSASCGSGCGASAGDAAGEVLAPGDVQEVDHFTTGNVEITTLNAGSGQALTDWLATNGFQFPASGQDILQCYVAKNWGFVAAKMTPTLVQGSSRQQPGEFFPDQLLALTFRTDTLVFPLRISAVSSRADDNEVLLYVFDAHRVTATNMATAEMEFTVGAKAVGEDTFQQRYDKAFAQQARQEGKPVLLVEYGALASLPDSLRSFSRQLFYLTRLRTRLNVGDMTDDLLFTDAPTDAPFRISVSAPRLPLQAGSLLLPVATLIALLRRRIHRIALRRALTESLLLMILIMLMVGWL
ncbi:MAG: hypothetical protein BWY76_03110 [bacterium ADurb.Bin429]|nr:MAG: hypothetical protein BWY76_03110 [bacterium ADurb.Bin429]